MASLVASLRNLPGNYRRTPQWSTSGKIWSSFLWGWERAKVQKLTYVNSDNETVDGVEFPGFPKALEATKDGEEPIVVADMSSNILSRTIPVEKYSCIFFGAQKNLGIAGENSAPFIFGT